MRSFFENLVRQGYRICLINRVGVISEFDITETGIINYLVDFFGACPVISIHLEVPVDRDPYIVVTI